MNLGAVVVFRAAALSLLLGPGSLRAEVAKEYQVKAAFLYNFTKFVEWPPDHFASAKSPIVIAVLGRDPFGGELEKIVRGRTVAGRPLALVSIGSGAITTPPKFHVLFVAAGEESLLRRLAGVSPPRGVLTVGETGNFSALGGIITFVVIDERVHFEINRVHAEAAGVAISAQLQILATPSVRSAGGTKR